MNEECRLILAGFGNVGRAFARLLLEKKSELEQDYAIRWKAVAIATGSHGAALDPQGIDLRQALEIYESGETLDSLSAETPANDVRSLISQVNADVFFENTPVNYEDGQPAIGHIETALQAGMHAITANKGPVAHAYQDLRELASRRGLEFYFESAVMDGAPIFSVWREALPGAHLHAMRGILNSTTNLILALMEDGSTLDQAIAEAQRIGVAETNPAGDIDGWDAAIKLAALVNVLMNVPLKPSHIQREGIRGIPADEVVASTRQGMRWKLICEARREDTGIAARVYPAKIPETDPLYHVSGTSSAITFESDVLGDLTITETDPGPQTTAYGLLADFINAVRNHEQ